MFLHSEYFQAGSGTAVGELRRPDVTERAGSFIVSFVSRGTQQKREVWCVRVDRIYSSILYFPQTAYMHAAY
jgi:hypothetical protein